jgi:transcriptional regulator with XRE-family HTH domain
MADLADDLAPLTQTLADLLVTLRDEAGLTQQQVADQIGYARVTVASAETSHRMPSEDFWVRCDDLFNAHGTLRRAYAQFTTARQEQARRRVRGQRAKRDARTARGAPSNAPVPTTVSPGMADPTGPRTSQDEEDLHRAWLSGVRSRRAPALVADQVTEITAQFRLLYHHLPPADLLPAVIGHLRLLDRLLHRAGDDIRRRLASEVAETAGLAAWLCGEADDGIGMLRLYRMADDAAELSGERALAGYIVGFHAQALICRAELGRGLAQLDAACAITGQGQPTVTAWLAALQAQALATAGRPGEALTALDAAERDFARGDTVAAAEWMYGFDAARLAAHRGACLLRLGDTEAAAAALSEALAELPASCVRRRAEVTLDLAGVRLLQRDIEDAVRLTVDAVEGFADRGSNSGLRRAAQFAGAFADAGEVAAAQSVRELILAYTTAR